MAIISHINVNNKENPIASNNMLYGVCSTAAATAAKTVTISNSKFTLQTGATIVVKFTITNTAANPTLNVDGTGAKAIYYNGAAITAGYLKANKVYEFIYNGTQWDLIGDVDTNTTYTSLPAKGGNADTVDNKHASDFATSAQGTKADNALPKSGGNVTGHIYLTGSKETSSAGNTSQIVFGTSSNNHVAISSNNNALVISPTTTATTNQIVLYLDKASQFPRGISANLTGTASKATADGNGNNIVDTYATKSELTSTKIVAVWG